MLKNKDDITVFALTSNVDLAERIVKDLGIPLGKCNVRHFADGEIMVQPAESVRGKHVFIVQSTCAPVSEHLMEVLVCLDACKRASAEEITCIIPYYGYARQDRKADARQPITSKLVADMLTVAGADRVVVFDLHAPQIQGFFDIPIDDMSAVSLLGQFVVRQKIENLALVSPAHGGATRARRLAEYIGEDTPIAIIDKRRTAPNVAEALNIIGDVEGKNCVIVDDIVDTGGSLCGTINMLKQNGAKDVYCVCTHGLLSRDCVDRLEKAGIKKLIMTDSVALPEEKKRPWIEVVSISHMISKMIEAIMNHSSMAKVYEEFNEI